MAWLAGAWGFANAPSIPNRLPTTLSAVVKIFRQAGGGGAWQRACPDHPAARAHAPSRSKAAREEAHKAHPRWSGSGRRRRWRGRARTRPRAGPLGSRPRPAWRRRGGTRLLCSVWPAEDSSDRTCVATSAHAVSSEGRAGAQAQAQAAGRGAGAGGAPPHLPPRPPHLRPRPGGRLLCGGDAGARDGARAGGLTAHGAGHSRGALHQAATWPGDGGRGGCERGSTV